MKLKIIGWLLSRPPVLPLLRAVLKPHVHLYDLDGAMYMGRWSVIDEVKRVNGRDTKKRNVESRILEALTGYASIRLHWIRRPDSDRDLHNHPFDYRTFVLKGFYAEEFQEPGHTGYRFLHAGMTGTGGHDKYHRIDVMHADGVWTLFCMTRNTNTWGFKVDGGFVRSPDYLRRRGYRRVNRSNGKVGV